MNIEAFNTGFLEELTKTSGVDTTTLLKLLAPGIAGGALGGVAGHNLIGGDFGALGGGAAGYFAGMPIGVNWALSGLKRGSRKQHSELSNQKNPSKQDRVNLDYLEHSKKEWQ